MPIADVNGQHIHFRDTGGDGPPIVFSHGLLMDLDMFAPQVEDLSDVYRVVTWDQRGFGSTRDDGGTFTCWDSARDLFGLLDGLGIERAVLAGAGQGGAVTLRAGLLHPDRVRGLVLLDTEAPTDEDGQDDVTDRLVELEMPALVLHGTRDEAVPAHRARDLCATLPDCRGVVEVVGAAEAATLTHPAEVNAAIRAFLEGLPA